MRITDIEDPAFEHGISKWYYELNVETEMEMFIGLHQEDERIQGVVKRRPFIDVGVSLIKVSDDDNFELVDFGAMSRDRQVELQAKL